MTESAKVPTTPRTGLALFPRSSGATASHVIPSISALFILLTGLLALAGKLHFPQALSREVPFLNALPERAALGFILIGFSMRLSRWERVNRRAHREVRLFRWLVVILALYSVVEHFGLTGVASAATLPLPTAFSFLLLSVALMLLGGSYPLCQALICGAGFVTLTASLAGLYGVQAGIQISRRISMDAPSALLLLVAIGGLLYGNSYRGWMAVVTSESIGGSRARLLLPAAILIPIFLGWIRLQFERWGLLSNEAGMVLHVVITIVLMGGVVWWNASTLVRSTAKHESVEQAVREMETAYRTVFSQSSEAIYITDVHGVLSYLNPAAERLFGYSNQTAQGLNIKRILVPPGATRQGMFSEMLGGPAQARRMVLAGARDIQVDVFSTVRFNEGNPVEILSIVQPVFEADAAGDEAAPSRHDVA